MHCLLLKFIGCISYFSLLQVTRVVLAVVNGKKHAVAVDCVIGKEGMAAMRRFNAELEVIVSGGAINSPQMLMLSGIGDRDELDAVGIECEVHLPDVGKHLQDHLMVPMRYSPSYVGYERATRCGKGMLTPAQTAKLRKLKQKLGLKLQSKDIGAITKAKASSMSALWHWLVHGSGPLASSAYDAALFCRTGLNEDHKYPDMQIGLFCGVGSEKNFQNMNLEGYDSVGVDSHDLGDTSEGLVVLPTLLHPYSTGTISLKSADPFEQPIIDPRYLSDRRDVRTLARGMAMAHALVTRTDSFKDTVDWMPTPRCISHLVTDNADANQKLFTDPKTWETLVEHLACTVYHPTSTCRMGKVVDSFLCVKGVERLRVIDASVMPHISRLNRSIMPIVTYSLMFSINFIYTFN